MAKQANDDRGAKQDDASKTSACDEQIEGAVQKVGTKKVLLCVRQDARKALQAADASAAKKAKHDAAAQNGKNDANEKAAAQAGYPAAAHLPSSVANVINEDGSVKEIFDQAVMCIKKSRRSEERTSYQTSWQRQKRQLQQKLPPVSEKKLFQAKWKALMAGGTEWL